MKRKRNNRVRLNEAQFRGFLRKAINEVIEGENPSSEEWERVLNGREPMFCLDNGEYCYIDYDPITGVLSTGYCTNTGFHPDGEAEAYVEGGDFQSALEDLYEQWCSTHETWDDEYAEEEYLDESIRRAMRKVLIESCDNEMALHKKGTGEVFNTNGSWAPQDLTNYKWKYDGDDVDRYVWRVKKTAEKAGASGPKGWPIAGWFGKHFRNFFNYLDEYSGDFDEVPDPNSNREMAPEELYSALDSLCYKNQIGYENYCTFSRN